MKPAPSDSSSDAKFEIGHVLFIDIVGYSKLPIEEQKERLGQLIEVVLATAQVRESPDEELVRLPTGDGMALVFSNSAEEPAHCALEIAQALRTSPQVGVRMGIHSGPLSEVTDVNGRPNVAGAGINLAQRVMDCGDAGHILLSKHVADDLEQYSRWRPSLHDLGECEVKHGLRIHLFNLYTDGAGNPARPAKLADNLPAPATSKAERAGSRWFLPVAIGLLVLLSLGGGLWWFGTRPAKLLPAPNEPAIPEKSIAVLPFENLSADKANAYFADGVQDEILTDLAKIADLKVISRTSVMQYKSGTTRNLREIGKQLGVAHLLEGSVQRAEGKVRVNAQLIDARTDAHLWAQTYDRDLADVFAIQSDIAKAIADQLQAKLAPNENSQLATKPTNNPDAYLLYLQANELLHVASTKSDAINADKLYAQAIAVDPNFALARARASILNSLMYSIGRAPERKMRARDLAEEALHLAPDLGEAHLALALCFYRIDNNYDAALKELALASAALPNNSEALDFSGYIYRRQRRWREALAVFSHAQKLDPRTAHFDGLPDTFRALRDWPRATAAYKHGLDLEPALQEGWVGLAYVRFAQRGQPSVAQAVLDHEPSAFKTATDTADARWEYAMMARDFAAAQKLVPDRPWDEFPNAEPKPFYQACVAVAQGDKERARALLEQIRPLHEDGLRSHPDDPTFHAAAGKLYALLGRKEDAIREARRAVELCPESKDAVQGPIYSADLAFVYAQSGKVDQAVALLSRLLTTPSAERITIAHLRLSWEWDPLRKDPRFAKILADPEPATIYH